ncbi:MAG: SGNH/GDSL hydrolase family protein, partial [Nitrospinota bacterium]|nr:SGNH/GDSL hydrolase family protein [Nitrospinota bacterium]
LPGFIGKTIANGASEPRPFYIVNNHGFRSLAEEMEFPPRGKVMALGDSFTQGAYLGQAETIPAVMARKLGSYVYNLGVGAYSTDQEYTAFTQWIDKVDVEWVVLFFFANDVIFVDQPIGHKFEKPLYRTINGKLDFSGLMPLPDEFVEEENAKVQAKIEMEKTFCCFSEMPEPVVERAMLKIRQYLFEARYPGLLFSTIVADIRKTKGKPTPSHLDVTVELLENPGKYQAQLDMVFQFLAKIKEESLKREKKYFVVFIPDFLQLYEPDIPARSNLRWAFMKSCAENGISCLDPSDELFRNSKYNDVYFIDDGHFSPHGARIVGEMVAEKIAENRP